MKRLEEKINGPDVIRIRRMLMQAYQAGFRLGAGACTKDPGTPDSELQRLQEEFGPAHLNGIAGDGILARFTPAEFTDSA